MTMLVTYAARDAAYLMHDSGVWVQGGRVFLHTAEPAKARRLPSLAAVATSRGDVFAGKAWKDTAEQMAADGATFDDVTAAMPAVLSGGDPRKPVHAYLIGWSEAHGRFRALVATPARDHQPQDVSGVLHCTPAPTGVEVTDAEREYRDATRSSPLPDGAPLPPPDTVEGWVDLAKRIHDDRACAGFSDRLVPIGGDVTLTVLHRDRVTAGTIHRFTPADFRRSVEGTLHPMGQLGPCVCDAGKAEGRRFIDCCIRGAFADLPCLCGSGRTLGACCALPPGRRAAELRVGAVHA